MKLQLNINMDNAAFADRGCQELADIFEKITAFFRGTRSDYLDDELEYTIRDSNGNTVGNVKVWEQL